MKYYFIINPISGSSDKTEILTKEIKEVFLDNKNDEYEIYVTKSKDDGEKYVKSVSSRITEDTVFLACGGDGTSYEVLNGLAEQPKAILGVVGVGSCNDFLKCFPKLNFRNIKNIVKGVIKKIDLIKCNDRYCLNEVNIGFDAKVNDDCNHIKAKTKNVKSAYNKAIIKNIIKKSAPMAKIKVDGEGFYHDKMFLMTCANGKYYGGGYCAAPKAIVDDGLLETLVIRNISTLNFVSLIGDYKKGTHLDKPKFFKFLKYTQSKEVDIEFEEDACVCLDGEIIYSKKLKINIEPLKLRFLLPIGE